jgi:hypothetical protein
LRTPGTERHQIKSKYEPETTKQLFECCTTLGFIKARYLPDTLSKWRHNVAIFGAAEGAVIERVKFLESEIRHNNKIDPSTIYLLSGQGPLWRMQEEQLLALLSQQKTKNDMNIDEVQRKFIEIGRQVFPDCKDFTAQYLNSLSTEDINKYKSNSKYLATSGLLKLL